MGLHKKVRRSKNRVVSIPVDREIETTGNSPSMRKFTKDDIAGYEYKHSTYVVSNNNPNSDLILVKENIHLKNGDVVPNLRRIRDFKRPYYITRESQRKYKEKRVWESLENVRRYECTQAELAGDIQRKLKSGRGGVKTLNRSPYLYGTDMTSSVLVKHQYMTKFPDFKTNYKVAHLDIEFDVVDGTDSINMISISCQGKVYQAVTRAYIGTTIDFFGKIRQCYEQEVVPILSAVDNKIKQFVEKGIKHEFELNFYEAEDECDAVLWIFRQLHHVIKPDMLSVWNLPYDTKKMMQALSRRGIAHEDVFCDPSVPDEFKYFKLKEGEAKIFDANGVAESKDPCDRWHRVTAPSNFFWVDQMSVRRMVRKHLNKEPSYSLGNILYKELGFGKLKGDKGIRSTGIDWHKHMQRNEKIFYCVYNMFDNIGAQLLDEKTEDLRSTFPAQCGFSELQSYNSQGRKLADDFYFDLLEKGYILTGTSDKMEKELDKYLVPLDGWISTLSAHLIHEEMGNRVLKEHPATFTKVVKWVLDIDVKSSYPSTGVWMNLSQETTKRSMCRIVGVDFEEQRRAGLNLCAGRVNAVEIIVKLCKAPTQLQMLQRFCKAKGIKLN